MTDDDLSRLTTDNVLSFLESLLWYLDGGSYFDTLGKLGKGPFHAGL